MLCLGTTALEGGPVPKVRELIISIGARPQKEAEECILFDTIHSFVHSADGMEFLLDICYTFYYLNSHF